jgi:hypothetical protein
MDERNESEMSTAFFLLFSPTGEKKRFKSRGAHRRKKLGQLEKSDCCSGQRSLISLASSSQSYRMPPQNIHQNESERKKKKKSQSGRVEELRPGGRACRIVNDDEELICQ